VLTVLSLPTSLVAPSGASLELTELRGADDVAVVHREFNRLLTAGEGYPQAGPIPLAEFREYWIDGKTAVVSAWTSGHRAFVGSYFLKPNGIGRASHVANAGYFVVSERRGEGIGEALVRHSMRSAVELGFDALQFNFVFESNPARRLYERLGFVEVGRVPEVIDGETVCIYWRRLDSSGR
jgi:ribosomal protein S18 acetylase RimI-like enzyme